MELYHTPHGYQTIHDKPLFDGACEECMGDGCYLHPLGGRVTCLQCEGLGSKKAKDEAVAKRIKENNKELFIAFKALFAISIIVILAVLWIIL